MKKVEAIIRKSKFDEVKEALHNVEVNFFSYWDVTGVGNEKEGTMVTGKAPVEQKDVYRSQAELVAAMSDRRYDNDPAYRQDVIAKLERSDNLTF